VRPDRYATGGDEHVGEQPGLERGSVGVLVVFDGGKGIYVRAGGGERGREQDAVRLVYLAGLELLAGPTKLGAGREDRDARLPAAHHLGDARCSERPDLRRVQASAAPPPPRHPLRRHRRAGERCHPG
jgi:hypothetical protein